MRCEHKRVNARCSLCDEMTTDERIEAIAKYHPGNEGSIAWLIAELRRARETLRELKQDAMDAIAASDSQTSLISEYVLSKVLRGLGEGTP